VRRRIEREWARLALADAAPETIALSVALGLTLGVFPIYGAPTLLCIAAACVFRPHVALLHAINAATSPLQLALLLPFHTLGALVLGGPIASGAWGAAARVVAGWLLVSIPLGASVYVALLSALRRRAQRAAI
jgi:hypothetical protein